MGLSQMYISSARWHFAHEMTAGNSPHTRRRFERKRKSVRPVQGWRIIFQTKKFVGGSVDLGDAQQSILQTRTRQQFDDGIEEHMKSWNEGCKAVNVTCKRTQQVDETARIVVVNRRGVLEALGVSDEWAFVSD